MTSEFNPLQFPISLKCPRRLSSTSAWIEHVPFAFVLIQILKPRIFVELGTLKGDSYSAFCQAVEILGLDTRCYAVDTWEGDEHSGFYGPEIYEKFKAYHDPLYGKFSKLLKCRFDEALKNFEVGSVDLLHIDGLHTYEAVKHDFEGWLPKMSSKGVILFHDTDVKDRDFGVWKLWSEIRDRFPSFEFNHGYGLGVLVVGQEAVIKLEPLLQSFEKRKETLREFFHILGERIAVLRLLFENGVEIRSPQKSYSQIALVNQSITRRDQQLRETQQVLELRDQQLKDTQQVLELRDQQLKESQRVLNLRDQLLKQIQQVLELRDQQLKDTQQVLELRDQQLRETQQVLELRDQQLKETRQVLEFQDQQLREAQQELAKIRSSTFWRYLESLRRLKKWFVN